MKTQMLGSTLAVAALSLLSLGSIQASAQASLRSASLACANWNQKIIGASNDAALKTDQLVVMRGNGKILMDWTDGTFKKSSPHTLWSVSKTVTASLLATAVQQGKISIDDLTTKYVPSSLRKRSVGKERIEQLKIRDLIAMTSGFKWSEHPDDEAQNTSVLPMMYSTGYRNFTKYIMNLDFAAAPGRVWNYSSANGNLAMAVLKTVYGADYDDMPWKNLFEPLGMKSARIEQDAAGVYIGATYVYLSAEDMAKLGALYLNDGVVNGKRILPEGWVSFSHQFVPESLAGIHTVEDFKHQSPYSRGSFWLNSKVAGVGRPYPHSPENMFVAEGLMGQWIIILPDQNLVIARTGHDAETSTQIDAIASGAIACFGK